MKKNTMKDGYFFHLGILKHVLGPCHTYFEHVLGAKEYVTCYTTLGSCYLACYMPLITHNMGG
jgi:hypothetical protein